MMFERHSLKNRRVFCNRSDFGILTKQLIQHFEITNCARKTHRQAHLIRVSADTNAVFPY